MNAATIVKHGLLHDRSGYGPIRLVALAPREGTSGWMQ